MKARLGFVSNSSSSSYIVAVAEVKDAEKVKEWLDSILDIEDYHCKSVSVVPVKKILDGREYGAKIHNGCVTVESFCNEAQMSNVNEDGDVLIVDITNNEGDMGRFEYDDERGEIDYDITLDDLPAKWQKDLFNGLNDGQNGLGRVDARYGAARNG